MTTKKEVLALLQGHLDETRLRLVTPIDGRPNKTRLAILSSKEELLRSLISEVKEMK